MEKHQHIVGFLFLIIPGATCSSDEFPKQWQAFILLLIVLAVFVLIIRCIKMPCNRNRLQPSLTDADQMTIPDIYEQHRRLRNTNTNDIVGRVYYQHDNANVIIALPIRTNANQRELSTCPTDQPPPYESLFPEQDAQTTNSQAAVKY